MTGKKLVFVVVCGCMMILLLAAPALAENTMKKQKASWYGTTAQGKKTASAEIFNRYDFTAAHKTLPFGTVVRVTTPATKREVLVAITDRGPFGKHRVVDVSKRAAAQLELIHKGILDVKLEVVSDKTGVPLNKQNGYYLRLTGLLEPRQAHTMHNIYELHTGRPVQALQAADASGYVLAIGPFEDFRTARNHMLEVSSMCDAEDIIEAPLRGCTLLPDAPVFESASKDLVRPIKQAARSKQPKKNVRSRKNASNTRVAQADRIFPATLP